MQLDYRNVLGIGDRFRNDFEGVGPTFSLNVHRPLSRHWALVGSGRASFLFGDTDLSLTQLGGFVVESDEHFLQVWEGRFGLEWSGTTRDGQMLFFLRAMIEAQIWDIAPVAGLYGSDLGFFGPTVSAGFVF